MLTESVITVAIKAAVLGASRAPRLRRRLTMGFTGWAGEFSSAARAGAVGGTPAAGIRRTAEIAPQKTMAKIKP
jgi:hypothetical protein